MFFLTEEKSVNEAGLIIPVRNTWAFGHAAIHIPKEHFPEEGSPICAIKAFVSCGAVCH